MNIKVEKAKEARALAMPEVKKLVKKFGRSTISGCLQRLQKYDSQMKLLAEKKKEIAQLEKELNK